MDIDHWKQGLNDLPLGDVYIYQEVESTNSEAEKRIQEGAPPFSLVLPGDRRRSGREAIGAVAGADAAGAGFSLRNRAGFNKSCWAG
ncbi:MAG: hypothetical protein P8Y37_05535 [Anaerolineales bacterium]